MCILKAQKYVTKVKTLVKKHEKDTVHKNTVK